MAQAGYSSNLYKGYKNPLPSKRSTDFYSALGEKMETFHGGTPMTSNDAKDKASGKVTQDIFYGHKLTPEETRTRNIQGIDLAGPGNTWREGTKEEAAQVMRKDVGMHVTEARKKWDPKLKKIGSDWNSLGEGYQLALSSLAYNVGGSKAGRGWTAVLKAAKDSNVLEFAKQLRRQDAGKFTAGMDNRVLKELYHAGLISSYEDVKSVLPLAKPALTSVPLDNPMRTSQNKSLYMGMP